MSSRFKRTCKKLISVAVSLAVVSSMTVTSKISTADAAVSFKDVSKNAFYYEAINEMALRGVIGGYADGSFKPNQPVTRAEAAKIIAYDLGLDSKNTNSYSRFRDVSSGDWFYQPVTTLAQAGGIGGYEDGTFRPNRTITRAEMASMLVRAYELKSATSVYLPFRDIPVNSWYAPAVRILYANKVTSGKSALSFAPNDAVTRGEMATFVYRAGKASQTEPPQKEPPVDKISWDDHGVIEKITSNSVKISGITYTLTSSVKNILGTHNDDVLNGAKIEFVQSDGLIRTITKLELNENGRSSSKLVLDGKDGTIAGNLIVNADYVSLKSIKVDKELTITYKMKNDFYAEDVIVNGGTNINSGDKSRVIFKDSKLQAVEGNARDVRLEARGSTTARYFNFTEDATIISEKTISKIIVANKNVDLILGSDTKVYNIELPRNVDLYDVVASNLQRKNINYINGKYNPEYNSYDGNDNDNVRYISGGDYNKLTITQDAFIRNVTVTDLILDPGNNGNVTLNNVEADYITIKSGGANSIHLIDTVVFKNITVQDDRTIRVVFGKGTKVNKVILKTATILDAGSSNADIDTVEIQTNSNNDIISFNGDAFSDTYVTISDSAFVETVGKTRLRKMTVTAGTGLVFFKADTKDLYISDKAEVVINDAKIENIILAATNANLNIRSGASITGALTVLADAMIKVADDNSIAKATIEKAPGVYVIADRNVLDRMKENAALNPIDEKLAISIVNASNGNVKVALNRGPVGGLKPDKFTFTNSINDGKFEPLVVTLTSSDSKSATFTFKPIQKTEEQQKVTIEATYDMMNSADLKASTSFVVTKNKAPVSKKVTIDPVSEGAADLEFEPTYFATDGDGDPLTFVSGSAGSSNHQAATVKIKAGKLVITPAASVTKDEVTTITVKITDGISTIQIIVEIHVKNVNQPPKPKIIILDPVEEGSKALVYSAIELAEDGDGDPLSLVEGSATSSNLGVATAEIKDSKLVVTPAGTVAKDGKATITVEVTDGKATIQVSFVIEVVKINHGPVAKEIVLKPVVEGTGPITFEVSQLATDEDEDELTLVEGSATSSNLKVATAEIKNGKLVVTPTETLAEDGKATITVKVTDGKATIQVSFVIEIKKANHAPKAIPIKLDPVNKGAVPLIFAVSALATDADEDELTLVEGSVTSSNLKVATAEIKNGKLVVTPAETLAEDGKATITVKVTDGKESISVSFEIEVKR
ncbi:MAG TPA: S-layer homology domain-containing protein [Bacillus bacterium]|nr:S-layer homology domain-containing protein [Bacillus sp. (in: firmicutes)]